MSQEAQGDRQVAGEGRWSRTIQELNGCPYYQLLGMRVVAMGDGHARLEMPVEEKLLQIYGGVHGGATASLADSALAVALISANSPEERAFTVELKVNYVATVSQGRLIAEARLFQRGRTIAAGEVEVRNEDGRLIAKGLATYMPVKG